LKTASRSLTSCAGVADTFGVLANVDIDEKIIRKSIRENRGAIVNYYNISSTYANKIISSVQRNLGIVKQEHVLASIIAIKLITGVTHLLVDIPVGSTSNIKTTNDALKIRKMIEYIGDMLNIQIDAVITDGSEPIGNGVGAVLEARDIMRVLRNKENAPQDLKEKSLFLAGRLIEFDPKVRGGQGYHIAKELLVSGRALEALNRIIYTQGKAPQAQLGRLTRDITADKNGFVESINNSRINRIGILAGAQQNNGSGIDLFKKVGDKVERGDVLYRIHSVNSNDFAFANSAVDGDNGYEIVSKK
jgi:thymidine phosphorylase